MRKPSASLTTTAVLAAAVSLVTAYSADAAVSQSAVMPASPSPAIIVQGGISPEPPCEASGTPAVAAGSRVGTTGTYSDGRNGRAAALAIGPKQDDPASPPSKKGYDHYMTQGGGAAAIGPKQDDPAARAGTRKGSYDLATAKGARSAESIGPKQDDPSPPPAPLSRCQPATR